MGNLHPFALDVGQSVRQRLASVPVTTILLARTNTLAGRQLAAVDRALVAVIPGWMATRLPPRRTWGQDTMKFDRITTDPGQMGGLPCIRGLRIPVATVIDMIADGMAPADIIDALPDLQLEDIGQALHYAAESVREREIPIRVAS